MKLKVTKSAIVQTVEGGKMTKDLAITALGTMYPERDQYLNTEEFIDACRDKFHASWVNRA